MLRFSWSALVPAFTQPNMWNQLDHPTPTQHWAVVSGSQVEHLGVTWNWTKAVSSYCKLLIFPYLSPIHKTIIIVILKNAGPVIQDIIRDGPVFTGMQNIFFQRALMIPSFTSSEIRDHIRIAFWSFYSETFFFFRKKKLNKRHSFDWDKIQKPSKGQKSRDKQVWLQQTRRTEVNI